VGGLWVEKKIEEGLWAKCSSSSSRYRIETEGGAQGRPAGGGRRPSRAWRRPGVGGTERGGQGRLVPVLTSGWGGLWREIDCGGRSVTGAACGGRRWELRGERGKCLGGAGRGASDAGLFIGAGRRYPGRGRARGARACLLMVVKATRPAGFAMGSRRDATAALLDKTRRAAMQWRASRGSGWSEVAGGLRQRRTGGRRWRGSAALRVERVTAQATRSRPGRHAWPGAARHAR
jgi:hypothetical protein